MIWREAVTHSTVMDYFIEKNATCAQIDALLELTDANILPRLAGGTHVCKSAGIEVRQLRGRIVLIATAQAVWHTVGIHGRVAMKFRGPPFGCDVGVNVFIEENNLHSHFAALRNGIG